MSVALRPVLRPSKLASLPSPFSSATTSTTTYICQACRHARLLRRPKRPYTFTQLVTLSDGSAFTMRTTSPMPVYRSTRDTRNAPLWNPSSKELMNVEDDEAGRLAGFRARFGKGFDAQREDIEVSEEGPVDNQKPKPESSLDGQKSSSAPHTTSEQEGGDTTAIKQTKKEQNIEEEFYYEFEEDDANLLDMISSYGQAPANSGRLPPSSKKGKK